ncbi:MAG: Acetaldehyde dehydrogenase, acetylating, in gene cluster for degradation of phenols, cresols, catechol [uncultured Rubrobacteraceae bacterium]|uniref:Acetaldehyde dehydrogenase n=1 Tax=uncultured Rubrobacteraceae bacterium TaxID=349277 RepID=A0A6J4PGS9_9ACTN|nr:MAG: Acetaldehyde dehydrogenase, acetylating, in gene cluster for degradation of phenols, cresols, catechol [uncultured Rubrobacteraceae bacterium]
MSEDGKAEGKIKAAIVGSGNIGTDLMYKLMEEPGHIELAVIAGIEPESEGLKRAREEGIEATHEGIQPVLDDPEIKIVFEATSAKAHVQNAPMYKEAGKIAVDLTPAAQGPYVVPVANLTEHLNEDNVNLMTCGAQATTPMAYAVSKVAPVRYAEMVSTVASLSAGPGTRQNIDEFTFTTARGLEEIGGAQEGKAIIILNPADPPLIMRNTVYVVPEEDEVDEDEITDSVNEVVAEVQKAVPGYQLKNGPTFDRRDTPWGEKPVIMMFLEVEGAGHFLPKYSGNLDIMTASARRVGEAFARHLLEVEEVVA